VSLPVNPYRGETYGRAVERAVQEELQQRGYAAELQEPHARGGDVFCWGKDEHLTIVEVRTIQVVKGPENPFF